MRDLCQIRDHHECGCAAGTCQQVVVTPAPVMHAVWKDFVMFFGAAMVITVATLCAVSETEKQFAKIDQVNQEQITWRK
ncbi:hypothetical protein [Rhizobium favelukesii]|uniref:hypothetical protein n=1 Tax=Rhizobium favelukesii TaxID=348824 RepID=UPI002160FAF0|nr:hypothetical protein [Rhizobium favelukesii]MCS0459498.1 hypothetical protein [Rhizobium favelukesii]